MKSVRDVRIVAVLFLIAGVAAVVQMILTRVLELSTTGLLALPTGIGLLRYSNAWRIVALVILWISLALFIIAMGMWLVNGRDISVTFWVRSPAAIAVLTLLSLALTIWEIRVLTRPDVRRSFELGDPTA